ncbi:MAG: transcription antitermination factor NusB [Ruminococcaceae bacterium]|nr:transcription antitermination factor NusB [Oscillospiraceae bacterium]
MNRKTARENAFILLFEQASKNDETFEEIYEKAVKIRELECDDFVKKVFFGVNENLVIIDDCIEKNIVGWKSTRLSIVSKAILRLAIFELMFADDIPAKVSINEAIELSKKFDDEKAYMLINGALNAAADSLGVK